MADSTYARADPDAHVWDRAAIGWHAVFAVLALLTGALIVGGAATEAPPSTRMVGLVLLGILCVCYAVIGVPAVRDDAPGSHGFRYVIVAVVLTLALFAVVPVGGVMLIVLYPHLWSMLRLRHAMTATVVVAVGIAVVDLARSGFSPSALQGAVVPAILALAIAPLLGVWITRIIQQSRDRARLLDELTATRAELAAVSHDAGVLAERERLAAEIHDTLAQGFTSVLMLLQAVDAELDDDLAEARDHLAQAERTVRDNLAEARSLVAVLTPTLTDAASLAEALRLLVDRFGRESGVYAELSVTGRQQALLPAAEVVLLRTTQEALSNIRKHAGAGRVLVRLAYDDRRTVLEITDDGCGFDVAAVPGDGFGLAGMRGRARRIGATLGVDSTVGQGTSVTVGVPARNDTVPTGGSA